MRRSNALSRSCPPEQSDQRPAVRLSGWWSKRRVDAQAVATEPASTQPPVPQPRSGLGESCVSPLSPKPKPANPPATSPKPIAALLER